MKRSAHKLGLVKDVTVATSFLALTIFSGPAFADIDGIDSLGGPIDVDVGAISSAEITNNTITSDDLANNSVGAA